MKKCLKAVGIICTITILIVFGVVSWRGYLIVDPYFHGDLAPDSFMKNLAGLEERATHVIRGCVKNDSRIVYSSQGRALANTVSIEIIDVIKGNIEIGSVIKIVEPYFIENYVLYTYGNYLPSKVNQEYFFFLGEQIISTNSRQVPDGYNGAYDVMNAERGRYLVPKNNRQEAMSYSRKALSLGKRSIDEYMRFYQSVIDNYIMGIDNKTEPLIEPRTNIIGKPEEIVVQGPFRMN